jgi:ParB family chromosome partitioning protein
MAKADMAVILKQRAEENSVKACSEDTAEYDILFGLELGDGRPEYAVTKLPTAKLVSYSKHPFRLYDSNKLLDLATSIKDHGLLHPIIVRPIASGKYEILAGHNRAEAFRLNGEPMIPAIIVNVDDCLAARIAVETNLHQREKLLPSEKAFAYKLQLDAMRHQGKKTEYEIDEINNNAGFQTYAQIEHKPKSREKVAASNGVDRNEIQRYIRLTYLIQGLLDLVDIGGLPFIASVELSYLSERQQEAIHRYFYAERKTKVSVKTAQTIRDFAEAGKPLNEAADIEKCLNMTSRKRDGPRNTITLKTKRFAPYLARVPKETDLESLFLEFLKERFG